MPTLVLRNAESGASCEIERGCGRVYAIEAATAGGLEALLEELLELTEIKEEPRPGCRQVQELSPQIEVLA